MTLIAPVGAWQGRLSVTDLGELSVGGVFDEIDISVQWLKEECRCGRLRGRAPLPDADTTPIIS